MALKAISHMNDDRAGGGDADRDDGVCSGLADEAELVGATRSNDQAIMLRVV